MKNIRFAVILLASIAPLGLIAAGQQPEAATQIIAGIESRRQAYTDVALQIWKYAETGFQEVKSCALLADELSEAGSF